MTTVKNLIEYLLRSTLTVEEALLCYSVYVTKEAPHDRQLLKLLTQYYSKLSYFDQHGQPLGIAWSTIIDKLERDGFLITYKGFNTKASDGNYRLNIAYLDVTDKFKDQIILRDTQSVYWEMFKELFTENSQMLVINGQSTPFDLPDKGETLDMVIERFWQLCGNGLVENYRDLMVNTTAYRDQFGLNMKITTYLKNYDRYVSQLEHLNKQSSYYNNSF